MAVPPGSQLEETSLGWELTGGPADGIVSGPSPTDVVEHLIAGTSCTFRYGAPSTTGVRSLPRRVWTPAVGARAVAGDDVSGGVWPLGGLRLETGRLVLRLPSGDEALELAGLAPPGLDTDPSWPAPPAAARPVATEVLQWWWRALGTWTTEHWRLPLGVWLDDRPVGFQELEAERFGLLRTVETSSWLVEDVRGRGVGTAMRAAVLGLAFEHLGAEVATSGAWEGNAGSLGVSRTLGYEDDGEVRHVHHERVGVLRRVRLARAAWDPSLHPLSVQGLAPCRGWFGEVAS